MPSLYDWIGFLVLIALVLGIDLYRTYRNPQPIQGKRAIAASCMSIAIALLFNGWIYLSFGCHMALDFLTGYLVEKSLSIDNLFVFFLIFSHLKVPSTARHKVLFWGILGAIAMRALLIWGGVSLVSNFHWIFYLFGLFLIFTGIRLAVKKETEEDFDKNRLYGWLTKHIPLTTYHGDAFVVKQMGKWLATPLLLAVILVEFTDLVFALDSVPAILGITTEPFIVYTSNIFAILGLRSLYFALEGLIQNFHLLHYALAFILVFIGTKMILADVIYIPTWATFVVLIVSITTSVLASLRSP